MTEVAPSNDSGNSGNTTPTNAPTPPAPGNPPEGYVPQDRVNSLDKQWREKHEAEVAAAKETALREYLQELGVTDPEEVKNIVTSKQEEDRKNQSEADTLRTDLGTEKEAHKGTRSELKATEDAAKKLALRSEARLRALELGVPPDYVDGFLKVANDDLGQIKVEGAKKNFALDADEVTKVLTSSLEAYPMFAGADPTPQTPNRIGVGSQPASESQPTGQIDWERMYQENPEQFEEYMARARMGEKFSLR